MMMIMAAYFMGHKFKANFATVYLGFSGVHRFGGWLNGMICISSCQIFSAANIKSASLLVVGAPVKHPIPNRPPDHPQYAGSK
jgi:hypothetical protein